MTFLSTLVMVKNNRKMIYLFIFMYLLICVILYDVYERKLHLRANYIVLYFLLH